MTDRIAPVSPVSSLAAGGVSAPAVRRVGEDAGKEQRGSERRSADRRAKDEAKKKDAAGTTASSSRELVPVGKLIHHDPADPAARTAPRTRAQAAAAAFAAQMLGQGGQRNGIRGGPTLMDNARSTYLGAQFSGEHERRPPLGTTTRKDV